MNGAVLADSVDAADALLEPHRIPRELKIDQQPAAAMQVQAFGAGIGGEQERAPAAHEVVDCRGALGSGEAAVQDR